MAHYVQLCVKKGSSALFWMTNHQKLTPIDTTYCDSHASPNT